MSVVVGDKLMPKITNLLEDIEKDLHKFEFSKEILSMNKILAIIFNENWISLKSGWYHLKKWNGKQEAGRKFLQSIHIDCRCLE